MADQEQEQAAAAEAPATPEHFPTINFRLPGVWVVLDPREDEESRAAIEETVLAAVGKADDAVLLRRTMQGSLVDALEGAQQAGAEMLYLCQEVGGMPMPIALSVHFPKDLRMSPAIGTSPASVIAVLKRSFEELKVDGIDEAVEIEIEESRVLRTVTIDEQTIETEEASREQRRISADYWYTVPGTKHVLLVNLATPLGDIPHVMLGFFDSIIAASFFAPAEETESSAEEAAPIAAG
ncbi:hypothetical protein [Microbacterium sp.]|uniref:hypothetical protein n=1 Tax=Microbacterium sp. TaxID=51671 RepID=UPI0033416485